MFPDPRDFLPIGVNDKGPAPQCSALESLLETNVFSKPIFGDPIREAGKGTNRVDTSQECCRT
jgi:hypothetical protein